MIAGRVVVLVVVVQMKKSKKKILAWPWAERNEK
jgi:hypothetical protein